MMMHRRSASEGVEGHFPLYGRGLSPPFVRINLVESSNGGIDENTYLLAA